MIIILDTNIIVAGLMSRRGASFKILSLLGQGKFEIALSVPLVLEYEDVAKRLSGNKIALSFQAIDDVLDYMCKVGIHQKIHYLWRPVLKDPKDDFVLELATNADADAIVTFNVRDFSRSHHYGIKILEPKQFLVQIGELT